MSSDASPHLLLDYLMPEQAQKHVTINQALRRLDGLVHLSVASRAMTSPPAMPENGLRYLIADGAADEWATRQGQVAIFEDTQWHYATPQIGWRLWVADEKRLLAYDGNQWVSINTGSATDFSLSRQRGLYDFSQSLPSLMIPSHSVFFGVTGMITHSITGPTAWQLGTSDGLNRFGTNLPLDSGSTINGPANPPSVFWQDTPLVLTPEGGAFSSGQLVLDIFYFILPIPSL